MDLNELLPVIEAIITAVSLIIAYLKAHDLKAVVGFFDPADTSVTKPPVTVTGVALTPARSYLMSDETKRWLISGLSGPDQQSMLAQVANAEAAGKVSYFVSVPGRYQEIEYGLIKGGGTGPLTNV